MKFFDAVIFFFYRRLAIPLVVFILHLFRNFLPAKMQEMISDREQINRQSLSARPVWIHASSGEIEYAKSLIREMKEQFPQIPILVTYFSPSAKKLIHQFPGIDVACAMPWDSPQDVRRFLNFYRPRVALIARTDVWPQMAHELHSRQIPSCLFSATFSENSTRSRILASSLTRTAFQNLSRIFCVSQMDAENIQDLGVNTPLEIVGDSRFDQVIYRLQNPKDISEELFPPAEVLRSPIFIAGSTWPADEEVLIPCLSSWLTKGGRVILAPHEVGNKHLEQIEKRLQLEKLESVRYSQLTAANTSWPKNKILLVDQVGILQELYARSQLAFVGGSFKDKVHSVMEPLAVGLQVMVGPYHQNNREALQFQYLLLNQSAGPGQFAVQVVQHSKDIVDCMEHYWQVPKLAHPEILTKVKTASGATPRLIAWIRECLGL